MRLTGRLFSFEPEKTEASGTLAPRDPTRPRPILRESSDPNRRRYSCPGHHLAFGAWWAVPVPPGERGRADRPEWSVSGAEHRLAGHPRSAATGGGGGSAPPSDAQGSGPANRRILVAGHFVAPGGSPLAAWTSSFPCARMVECRLRRLRPPTQPKSQSAIVLSRPLLAGRRAAPALRKRRPCRSTTDEGPPGGG